MNRKTSRREFVKTGTAASAALLASQIPNVHASPQELGTVRVGVIGCGGRGSGAAEQCLESAGQVELVAMADMFPDRLQGSRNGLKDKKGYKVEDKHTFTGLDAYKKVLDMDVNLVILATPPGFRPIHFAAAVDAGKHIFFEKPVAVDPVGIRKVIEAGEKAKAKKQAVVSGTQRRHQKGYIETIGQIHAGAIGDIVSARAYWNGGGVWHKKRQPDWDDLTFQMRNWYYYDWLCGDHIVEQHIHNLDVMNWVMKSHPLKCIAVGGRQSRVDPELYGHIYDHFACDFEYPGGVHVMSMCRHWPGPGNVSEAVVGTKGTSDCSSTLRDHAGKQIFKAAGGGKNPYVQEHTDLIESIRKGEPLNEARQVAESTLTAIMGREAAYTGKEIKWDELMKSDMNLMPEPFGPKPLNPRNVPMPGSPR